MPHRLLAILALSLTACSVEPKVYAPPAQRRALSTTAYGLRMLPMTDDSVVDRIIQDVSGGHADAWRWTGQKPTFRIHLLDTAGLQYRIELAIAEVTLKDTGPATITFLVNEKPLGKQTYSKPGTQTFEAPIPPEMLLPNADNTFGAVIDKVWNAPGDSTKLGFILSSIGIVRAGKAR